jgi:hypothetical protein
LFCQLCPSCSWIHLQALVPHWGLCLVSRTLTALAVLLCHWPRSSSDTICHNASSHASHLPFFCTLNVSSKHHVEMSLPLW